MGTVRHMPSPEPARRVIVCGGRNFTDAALVETVLSEALGATDVVVHGAARGADRLAGAWARRHGHRVEEFAAEWDRYGKRAGYLRNRAMLAAGADLVIAFPGGRGTAMMIDLARAAGVAVIEASGPAT